MQSAQDFYGESLGRAKSQLRGDGAQLETLAEQIPQEEAQVQEMVDFYYEIESRIDQAAQEQGLEDAVNEAAQQAQDTVGQAAGQAQEAAAGAAQQAQDAAGQATQQGQQQGGGGQEQPNATQAAAQKAEELGVDLSQVEGSGSEGRITIKDGQSA